jgi:Tol biopolymer transport system component
VHSPCARRRVKTSRRVLEGCFIHLHITENGEYTRTMPSAEFHAQAARRQLERVLASAGFCRNERLSRFLRFVIEQHLEGRDAEIKESVIALEVFGRGPDHDPKQDSIVRTEAARLRARIGEYYLGEGKNDALVIELPKGGYTPFFRERAVQPATSARRAATNSPPALVGRQPAFEGKVTTIGNRVRLVLGVPGVIEEPRPVAEPVRNRPRRVFETVVVAVLLAAGAAAAVLTLRSRKSDSAPFERTKTVRITSSGQAVKAVISLDGRYIAYTTLASGDQSLVVMRTTTLHAIEIVPPAPVRYAGITFSPDSEAVYYILWKPGREASVLYRIPVMGGSSEKLKEKLDSPVTFSPDGKRFAFVRESSNQSTIVVSDLDSGAERKLVSRKLPEVLDYPAWSPDGRTIAATTYDSSVVSSTGSNARVIKVEVADGRERPVSAHIWGFIRQISWLGNGRGLIMSACSQESAVHHLWLVSYPGGAVRKVTDGVDFQVGASVSGDSRQIITVEEHRFSAIGRIASMRSQNPESVVFQATGRSAPLWTPDHRILFEQEVNGSRTLWTVDADGNHQKQMPLAGDNYDPSIASDGRLACTSDRSGSSAIWTMDMDGGNASMLAKVVAESNPKISPDGKWVVFTSSGVGHWATLWRVGARGGPAVELNDRYWEMPVVSPDGKWIAGFYRDQQLSTGNYPTSIAVIGINRGKPSFTLPTPMSVSYGAGIRWTPDGRELTYVHSGKDGDNIWSQPFSGGAPHQVTRFHGETLFRFDWSANGQELVFSRGVQTRDVIAVQDSRGKE